MGIKSVINTDRLYWLGRYSERVYTTAKLFARCFDTLIEQGEGDHAAFCRSLQIPNVYADKDEFIAKYAFSEEDPNSIRSNLMRAYDNAVELREEIGSSCLSYIQLAMYDITKAEKNEAPMLSFQKLEDRILAFWGCVDDEIDDENTRNIIKIGKRVERLDLYARLRRDREDILREIDRLSGRIDRTQLLYNHAVIEKLRELIEAPELDHAAVVSAVERIMEC